MEILRETNIDFMKYRKFWIVVSLALVLVGIFSVFVHGKLNVGVDFAGGTQINLQFKEKPQVDRLRTVLEGAGLEEFTIQSFGREDENEVMVRTRLTEGEEQGSLQKVVAALDRELNPAATGKPDINRIGADAIAAILTQADPDKLGAAGAARYLQTAEKILEQRRKTGLFNAWDELSGLGGLSRRRSRPCSSALRWATTPCSASRTSARRSARSCASRASTR